MPPLAPSGAVICSDCAGAFLLAESGLFDSRSATTHWIQSKALGNSYPKIRVAADKPIIDDGDIITAGGVMAWIDLGLCLVDRFIGPTIRPASARFFLVDAAGRERPRPRSRMSKHGNVVLCVHLRTSSQTMSTTMTVRLENDVKDRLDVLAEATRRSKSFLAAEAIRAYVENNEWQIGEIQAALKEADAGDFASDKDVGALAKKWKVNAG